MQNVRLARREEAGAVDYFERAFFRLAGDRFLEAGAATPLATAFC